MSFTNPYRPEPYGSMVYTNAAEGTPKCVIQAQMADPCMASEGAVREKYGCAFLSDNAGDDEAQDTIGTSNTVAREETGVETAE
mmetsp:Transcript_37801/g.87399  ORF Transcript_37801/g.87399 Transcript_37801/m.87399 type:complete len:84 (+) Transcript_37801:807-1058(+)